LFRARKVRVHPTHRVKKIRLIYAAFVFADLMQCLDQAPANRPSCEVGLFLVASGNTPYPNKDMIFIAFRIRGAESCYLPEFDTKNGR